MSLAFWCETCKINKLKFKIPAGLLCKPCYKKVKKRQKKDKVSNNILPKLQRNTMFVRVKPKYPTPPNTRDNSVVQPTSTGIKDKPIFWAGYKIYPPNLESEDKNNFENSKCLIL